MSHPELHGGLVGEAHEDHDQALKDVGWNGVRELHEAYMDARRDVKDLCRAMMDAQPESDSVAAVREMGVKMWNSWAM